MEEVPKEVYEKLREKLMWDLKVVFVDFARFNQYKDQNNVDVKTLQKQLHDQTTAVSRQQTEHQQLRAETKRLEQTSVSYEDLKKELVAYSLVEDFEQYRMKMDLLEQQKEDTIGKLRFEFFYKFVEADKFEQRLKQTEQSIREDMVSQEDLHRKCELQNRKHLQHLDSFKTVGCQI